MSETESEISDLTEVKDAIAGLYNEVRESKEITSFVDKIVEEDIRPIGEDGLLIPYRFTPHQVTILK